MENRIRKLTFISLFFLCLVGVVFILYFFINRNVYRRLLSILTWFVAYPSFITSVILSIVNLNRIYSSAIKLKKRFIILNSFSLIVFLLFIAQIIWVNIKF